jgi:hypothetical protein
MRNEHAHNLREIKRVASDRVEDEVLQLVDDAKQIISQRGHRWRLWTKTGHWRAKFQLQGCEIEASRQFNDETPREKDNGEVRIE